MRGLSTLRNWAMASECWLGQIRPGFRQSCAILAELGPNLARIRPMATSVGMLPSWAVFRCEVTLKTKILNPFERLQGSALQGANLSGEDVARQTPGSGMDDPPASTSYRDPLTQSLELRSVLGVGTTGGSATRQLEPTMLCGSRSQGRGDNRAEKNTRRSGALSRPPGIE